MAPSPPAKATSGAAESGRRETTINARGLLIGGAVCMGIGALNMAIGATILEDTDNVEQEFEIVDDDVMGKAFVLNGAIFMTVGIPLFVAGIWPVEKKVDPSAARTAPPPPSAELSVRGSRADLRVTF